MNLEHIVGSTSDVMRDMQIKATVRYHHIPIRIAQIQKTDNKKTLIKMGSNRNAD